MEFTIDDELETICPVKQKYRCDKCNKEFKRYQHLTQHMNNKYYCDRIITQKEVLDKKLQFATTQYDNLLKVIKSQPRIELYKLLIMYRNVYNYCYKIRCYIEKMNLPENDKKAALKGFNDYYDMVKKLNI